MRICVVLPIYNESKTIAKIIGEIQRQNLEVVVIDDGSLDDTSQIVKTCGVAVLKNEKNIGKGASLIKGFNYALSNNFDAVITMDGDGQHAVSDIPYFIGLSGHSQSGLLIGNRMSKTGNMPYLRLMTNKFMSWLISKITGQSIPDTQCGFRLIKKEVLGKIILTTNKFETETEILIKAARFGFKIESVPINTIYTGQESRINPFWDTLRFIKFIVKFLINV